LDVVAAAAGLFAGIVVSGINFIYSNAYTITVGPVLAAACLVYLLFHRQLFSARLEFKGNERLFFSATIVFFLLLSISVYSLRADILHRPVAYFVLTAVAASMIAIQIACYRGKGAVYLILLEILLLSLSLTASAYWVFPNLPGVDTWVHREYVRSFVDYGGIPSSNDISASIGDYYLSFPMMHLNVAAAKLIGGAVDYKTAMFIGASLPLVLSSLFVFLICRRLVDTRVGLLAMLLLSLSNYFLQRGFQPIPTSYGLALFGMIVYLLIRNTGGTRACFTFLLLSTMVVLVMTHTVSAFILFIFMLSFLVGGYAYRLIYRRQAASESTPVTPILVLLFGVIMLSYWMYSAYLGGDPFFSKMVNELFRETSTEFGFGEYELKTMTGAGQILNISGFLVLLFSGACGCLWLFRESPGRLTVSLVATVVTLLGMPLVLAVFGIEAIVPDRWFAFSFFLLAMVASIAILGATSHSSHRQLCITLLICIVFAVSFFMSTNKISNMDSPIYTPELNVRSEYSNAEMMMGRRAVEFSQGRITTDVDYGRSVIKVYLGRISDVYYEMTNEEQTSRGIVLWREVMSERPVRVPLTTVLGDGYREGVDRSHHLVYCNNDSRAYLAR